MLILRNLILTLILTFKIGETSSSNRKSVTEEPAGYLQSFAARLSWNSKVEELIPTDQLKRALWVASVNAKNDLFVTNGLFKEIATFALIADGFKCEWLPYQQPITPPYMIKEELVGRLGQPPYDLAAIFVKARTILFDQIIRIYRSNSTKYLENVISFPTKPFVQFVILGGGFDNRSNRIRELSDASLYFLESPEILKYRTAKLGALASGFGKENHRYIEWSLNLDDLPKIFEKLEANGEFEFGKVTLWIAEGFLAFQKTAYIRNFIEVIDRIVFERKIKKPNLEHHLLASVPNRAHLNAKRNSFLETCDPDPLFDIGSEAFGTVTLKLSDGVSKAITAYSSWHSITWEPTICKSYYPVDINGDEGPQFYFIKMKF